ISEKEKGAHTGDEGAFQIKDYATYSIVGHSERKESRELVRSKVKMCEKYNLTPIICFTNPESIKSNVHKDALLAWEDPDNISVNGVYREKNISDIYDSFKSMKNIVPEKDILYGGSVNESNITDIAAISEVSGVLVGSASLDPAHFYKIINAFEN
ncbi:triose-phosphate isomerase, partial [Patescibacteria group bacterium]